MGRRGSLTETFRVLSFLLLLIYTAVKCTTLPTCCQVNGILQVNCSCINESTGLITASVAPGTYARYHFILQNYSLIDVVDALRPRLWVTVNPCQGSTSLFINPLASSSSVSGSVTTSVWPSVNASLWNSTKSYATNELNVQLQYGSYYITVLGSLMSPPTVAGVSVNYTLHARLEGAATSPTYPQIWNPTISTYVIQTDALLLPTDPMSMLIGWNSSASTSQTYLYRVYYVRSDITQPIALSAAAAALPCATSSATVNAADGSLLPGVKPTYANPDECVLTTACGIQQAATASGPWFPAAGGGQPVFAVVSGLMQQTAYSFIVLIQDNATGAVSAYAANRGTPAYTKVNAATSNSTIGAVAGGAVGIFVFALCAAFLIKKRIDRQVHARAMAKYHAVNTDSEGQPEQLENHGDVPSVVAAAPDSEEKIV